MLSFELLNYRILVIRTLIQSNQSRFKYIINHIFPKFQSYVCYILQSTVKLCGNFSLLLYYSNFFFTPIYSDPRKFYLRKHHQSVYKCLKIINFHRLRRLIFFHIVFKKITVSIYELCTLCYSTNRYYLYYLLNYFTITQYVKVYITYRYRHS